ncbi:MAG: hypothetical protein QM731_25995 [Chitinophagaceae bacterium]
MKFCLITCLLSLYTTTMFAQELIKNSITLANKTGETISSPVQSKAAIVILNGQTFRAIIDLFPIVPDPDAEDSLAQQNKPLTLVLEGRFPVQNMDFLTTTDNGHTWSMNVTATVNDSTQNMTINFGLLIPRSAPVDPSGNYPGYPARIAFNLLLQPQQFGLDLAPYNISKLILVQVPAARINKQEN